MSEIKFNKVALENAIKDLPDEGKEQILALIKDFDNYKLEVARLTEVLEGYEELIKVYRKRCGELDGPKIH